MGKIHQHVCSVCGTLWEHCHESYGRFRDHICESCGYLELMVYKPGDPPMGPADFPQAVVNFLNVLNDSDDSARTAAAFSLGRLGAEPDRAVPALAWTAIWDTHLAARQAAVEGLRRFGFETCRQTAGYLWTSISTAIFSDKQATWDGQTDAGSPSIAE